VWWKRHHSKAVNVQTAAEFPATNELGRQVAQVVVDRGGGGGGGAALEEPRGPQTSQAQGRQLGL